MINAQIIADSINPRDCRLTTFVLDFPRWVLAELNTHRVFSRNAASSRAIPINKMIEMVLAEPAVPSVYGKNQSGMQSKSILEGDELKLAKEGWLQARNRAIESAKELAALGLHKQYVNRTIENFMYIKVILSGTEFDNFFALRAHPDAQPELQALAYKMLEEYNKSEPKSLQPGEWHIPFGDNIDSDRVFEEYVKKIPPHTVHLNSILEGKIKIAIARCARVSYFNFEGKDDYEADIKLCDRLFASTPRHLSPTEHVAKCLNDDKFIGNFRGWEQYRYQFVDQSLIDPRVIKKKWKG